MITPPSGLSGNSVAPITISAINDGAVWLNGQGVRRPVLLGNNDWFILEGFNASDSHISVVSIGSANNNIIRRVCAWNANSTKNERVFGIAGSGYRNTIEDSCGFGGGRAIVQISQGGNNTTIRRFWGVYEADTSLTGPESVFQFAYNGTAHTLENVIGTWKQTSSVNPKSIFNLNNEGADHRILGSMAYVRAGDTMSASSLFSTDWASVSHGPVTIRDVVLYTEQASKKPWSLASGGSPCTNCSLHSTTAIGGAASTIGTSWSQTNRGDYASISVMNMASANPFQTTAGTGARMCFRYVNGVLTSTKLWPWPMDQRIRAALDLAGKNPDAIFGGAGKTLTDLMESMFGTIPSSCKTSSSTSVVNTPSIPSAASNLRVSY
jgi:hypothetical protein